MKYKILKQLIDCPAWTISENGFFSDGSNYYRFGGTLFTERTVKNNPDWFEPVIERWRADAKNDEYISQYYCLRSCGETFSSNDSRGIYDQKTFDYGNYFRTAEQAEEASKRINKCLMDYHAEIGE